MIPRLSAKEALVLRLLSSAREQYGLELVKGSDGKLKRGTVYTTLHRMSLKGLIDSKLKPTPEGEQGPPRRVYWITGAGESILRARAAAAAAFGGGVPA